ncbi:uncharacterized protein LOC112559860 [Pomacea canaliculata]|uniref:uncharacterized protein LOC112559860 n=1 Tax=Pomacea canaliculata TaxID=400727 RepID=UPI000D729D2F|nr:uncharacterized protein LOC112559860 [Pomacea canaliculata]
MSSDEEEEELNDRNSHYGSSLPVPSKQSQQPHISALSARRPSTEYHDTTSAVRSLVTRQQVPDYSMGSTVQAGTQMATPSGPAMTVRSEEPQCGAREGQPWGDNPPGATKLLRHRTTHQSSPDSSLQKSTVLLDSDLSTFPLTDPELFRPPEPSPGGLAAKEQPSA